MRSIGIIGFGNMGASLAARFKSQADGICVYDKDSAKTEQALNIEAAKDITLLVGKSEVVILAVKPQDFGNLLLEIKNSIEGKLVISIAAGITTGYIEKYLGEVKVVRTMPNMPARIGKAMTCICKGRFAKETDLAYTKQLFESIGQTLVVDSEDMMDAATAISGSGPGYLFDMIERKKIDINDKDRLNQLEEEFTSDLARAAEKLGFGNQDAIKLASATTSGSIGLIASSGLSAKELVDQVASKGGTTEAALGVLHTEGSLEDAVIAARDRARELSRK